MRPGDVTFSQNTGLARLHCARVGRDRWFALIAGSSCVSASSIHEFLSAGMLVVDWERES